MWVGVGELTCYVFMDLNSLFKRQQTFVVQVTLHAWHRYVYIGIQVYKAAGM